MDKVKQEFTNKKNKHDAIIISFSGHGDKENIWFSDYDGDDGKININEMQKYISYPFVRDKTLRDYPRIAIIDACRGQESVSTKTKGTMSLHPMDNWVSLYSNAPGYKSRNTSEGGCLITSCYDILGDIIESNKRTWSELTQLIKKQVKTKSNQVAWPVGAFDKKVFFKASGKGGLDDGEYKDATWNVSIITNGKTDVYNDTKIGCDYEKKQITLKFNNKNEFVLKPKFKSVKKKGTFVNIRSASYLVKINCKEIESAVYWFEKIKSLNI
eukprot:416257_1